MLLIDILRLGSRTLAEKRQQMVDDLGIIAREFKRATDANSNYIGMWKDGQSAALCPVPGIPEFSWVAQVDPRLGLILRCRNPSGRGETHFEYGGGKLKVADSYVESFHALIPELVDEIFKKFPWLVDEMEPILRAGGRAHHESEVQKAGGEPNA